MLDVNFLSFFFFKNLMNFECLDIMIGHTQRKHEMVSNVSYQPYVDEETVAYQIGIFEKKN